MSHDATLPPPFQLRASELTHSQRLARLEVITVNPDATNHEAGLGGGWNEWQRYVLAELKELRRDYKALDAKLDTLAIEMAIIKTKGTIFGAIAGSLAAVIVNAWFSWRR